MKKFTIGFSAMILTTAAANACMTIEPRFRASETSFSASELSVAKNSNGLVFKFEGDEFYFNHAKQAWCFMPETGYAKLDVEKKKKEVCHSKKTDTEEIRITDNNNKLVAIAKSGSDSNVLIINSVTSDGKIAKDKPYLRLTSEGSWYVPKHEKCMGCGPADGYVQLSEPALKVEYVKNASTRGEVVKSGGNGLYFNRTLGDVVERGPVPKSMGLIPQDSGSVAPSDLNGNSISSGSSCGAPRVSAYQAAGGGAVPKDSGGFVPVNK